MARTNKKVTYSPKSNHTGEGAFISAASSAEEALKTIEGRWKLLIVFHLFAAGSVRRFSELQRAIPAVSQKMLIQQLRELERDGVLKRTVYPVVPPKVEYGLTELGQALCPALGELLKWAELRRSGQLNPDSPPKR